MSTLHTQIYTAHIQHLLCRHKYLLCKYLLFGRKFWLPLPEGGWKYSSGADLLKGGGGG